MCLQFKVFFKLITLRALIFIWKKFHTRLTNEITTRLTPAHTKKLQINIVATSNLIIAINIYTQSNYNKTIAASNK